METIHLWGLVSPKERPSAAVLDPPKGKGCRITSAEASKV